MHHITSFTVSGVTLIEVDGSLGVVAAYDLRCIVVHALQRGSRTIGLDLTRVTSADVDGVLGLRRCCDAAVGAGAVLSLTGCSRPLRADLASVEARLPAVGPTRRPERNPASLLS